MRILPLVSIELNESKGLKQLGFNALMAKPLEPAVKLSLSQAEIKKIKISKIYNKLKNQLPQVETSTIEKMIERFDNFSRDDVLTVMYRLTKYATVDSFTRLRDYFNEHKISGFITCANDYQPHLSKKDKSILEFVKNKSLNSNFLFNYFFRAYRGKAPLLPSSEKGFILDKDSIPNLKENFSKFKINPKIFYVKDFEGAYNIFSQHQDFETLVGNTLENLKYQKQINKGLSTDELLDKILNPLLDYFKLMEINPIIIDNNLERKITAEMIADNMSPKFPKYEKFEEVLSDSLKWLSSNESKTNTLLDLIEEKIYAYSPKAFCKNLQKLKVLIDEEVKKAGKDLNKVFFIVPNLEKSFVLVNYMFQKINDIPASRFIFSEFNSLNYKQVYKSLDKFFLKGSTLVILDDATLSGLSLINSPVHYDSTYKKENFDFLFATVYSSDRAFELFNERKMVQSNDDMISVNYQQLQFDINRHKDKEFFRQSLLMLPHIAPDNNLDCLRDLFKLFYPAGDFVQESWE